MTARGSLFLAFAGMGATAALVPAVLPSLAADLGVPTSAVLGSIPALFAGLLFGVLAASLLMRRSSAFSVRCGAGSQLLGMIVLLVAPTVPIVIGGAAIAGFGFGLVEASAVVLARSTAKGDLVRLLALLTATVAIVATVSPLLIVASGSVHGERVVLAVAALLQLWTLLAVRTPSPEEPGGEPAEAPTPRAALAGRLVPLAIGLFCYVGVESILSGWSAATVQRELGTTASTSAIGTSVFWGLMVVGRLLASRVLRTRSVSLSQLPACVGAIALLLVASVFLAPVSVFAGLVMMGIAVVACGPCYALFMGSALDGARKEVEASVTSTFIACGAIGGALVPLLATVSGASEGILVAAIFAIIAFLAVLLARMRSVRKVSAS